jgi:hypothetical protein
VSKQTQGVLKPQLAGDIDVPSRRLPEEMVVRGSPASFASRSTNVEPRIGVGRCLFNSATLEE